MFSCHWLLTLTCLIFHSLLPVNPDRFTFPCLVVFPAWHIIWRLTCRLPCLFVCRLSFASKETYSHRWLVAFSSCYVFSCFLVPGLSPANVHMLLLVLRHIFSRPWPLACYPWYAYVLEAVSLSPQTCSLFLSCSLQSLTCPIIPRKSLPTLMSTDPWHVACHPSHVCVSLTCLWHVCAFAMYGQ
jgi:hypothetical protein